MKPILKYLNGNRAGQQALKQDLESRHLNFHVGPKLKAPPSLGKGYPRACFSGKFTKVNNNTCVCHNIFQYIYKGSTEINVGKTTILLLSTQIIFNNPNAGKKIFPKSTTTHVHHKLVLMLIEQFKKMSIPSLQKVIGN